MIYCSTGNLERIFVHPNNDIEELHWVDISMSRDKPAFAVTCCCDDEWIWEFWYSKTNYELVKHMVMDCIFDAEDMDDLIDSMDETFDEFFMDIVVDETDFHEDECDENCECGCDGNCDNCSFNEDKYLH